MNALNLAPIPLASTWVLPFSAMRADQVTPIDITGAWVGFTVAYALGQASAFQLTTLMGGGIVITNGPLGLGQIMGTPALTAGATTGGSALYSLIVELLDGTVIPLAAGLVTLVDYPGRAP